MKKPSPSITAAFAITSRKLAILAAVALTMALEGQAQGRSELALAALATADSKLRS